MGERLLRSLASVERRDQHAVAERSRRVACAARGQRKGVRPGGPTTVSTIEPP